MLGARATKTKLGDLYFSGRDSEVNKQLQNCYRKKARCQGQDPRVLCIRKKLG